MSNTQPNSAVVMTEMIDENGYPVVVPIHMDKNSDRGIINEIASIYGRRNAEKFVENSELLINDKDRVNDMLSGSGLQLPELKAESDSIFNYSIPNSSQNDNSIAEDVGFRNHEFTTDAQTLSDSRVMSGNSVEVANRKMFEDAQRDGFTPPTYMSGNGIDPYDEHRINQLSSNKGRVSGKDNFSDFIQKSKKEALDNDTGTKKFYFGTVSSELASDIYAKTGIDQRAYSSYR